MPRSRRNAGTRRLAALGIAAGIAFVGGAVAGAHHQPQAERQARAFAAAWERLDHAAMYRELSATARSRATLDRFSRTYLDAADALTLADVAVGDVAMEDDGEAVLDVRLRTRLFGTLSGELRLPVDDGGVAWRPHHVFPGLAPGIELARDPVLPKRAALLTRDGRPLARGRGRTSPLPDAVTGLVGELGPIPPEREAEYVERGVPAGADVGLSGLEREFDARLTGTPGGELRAGGRLIARAEPRPAEPVRTTIDADAQAAAVEALAGRYGGIAVLQPRTGEVLALAGLAADAPQPPGSTFKIVTLAGALEAGITRPRERFPVQTATTLSGVELQNANGESCGGTLIESFAHSCNSVFGPLGAELGSERLIAAAEAFGFNEAPSLTGASPSTIPVAEEMGDDDLVVGSSAIGQGKVLATALQMASVAATVGNRGVRMRPTLLRGDRDEAGAAVPRPVARVVARGMRAVVTAGTGTAAAIEGVTVAGKTGTAELRSTQGEPPPGEEALADDPTDTDAWFAAYAPARRPRMAVAVLLIGNGTGGGTAAPAARVVLQRALAR